MAALIVFQNKPYQKSAGLLSLALVLAVAFFLSRSPTFAAETSIPTPPVVGPTNQPTGDPDDDCGKGNNNLGNSGGNSPNAGMGGGGTVVLTSGTVTAQLPGISLGGPSFGWSHGGDFNSGLLDSGGGSIAIGNSGTSWMSGSLGPYIRMNDDDNIEFIQNASFKQIFEKDGSGGFNPPVGTNATLVKSGSTAYTEIYTLTNYDNGSILIFYAPTTSTPVPGRLKERTSREVKQANKDGYLYDYIVYGPSAGLVDYITTPGMWIINYSYDDSSGNLVAVKVHAGAILPSESEDNVVEKIEYTYFDDLASNPNNGQIGSAGDLVQVKVSQKTSSDADAVFSIVKTTQYRYYVTGSGIPGKTHQLKMILEPDAIERAVANESTIANADAVLTTGDSVVQAYANQFYTYYTIDLNTAAGVETPFTPTGTENLQTKYGGVNFSEIENNGLGRVKTQTSNGGCSSCGGGSGNGLTTTWFYMNQTVSSPTLSDVVRIVIEDTADSTAALSRKVYGLNTRGAIVREAQIENPSATTSIKAWCTSLKLNSDNQITEERAPSAHTVVSTEPIMKKFFNPAVAGNETDSINASAGLVTVNEYDSGNLISKFIKQGNTTNTSQIFLLSATDWTLFGGRYLPVAKYEYLTPTIASGRTGGIKTTINYSFWDTTNKINIREIETVLPTIVSGQNGSGTASTTEKYFDNLGRVRWTKDGEGYCSYYSYHPVNGQLALQIDDINPGSPGSEVTSGSAYKWDSWIVGGALVYKPSRGGSLPTPIAQVTKTEYDDQGRTYLKIDNDGSKHFTVYGDNRTAQVPYWDGSKSLLPITVNVTDDGGQSIESFQIKAGYTGSGVTVTSSQPIAVGNPGTTNYVSWTRNFYESIKGKLVKELNYHKIPSSGFGSHITNYYVTGYEYDSQGRPKTTVQTSSSSVHQVSQNVYDFLGRVIESRMGAGASGLNTSANNTLGTIVVPNSVTPTIRQYDGGGVGDGRVTSRKQYYGSSSNEVIEMQPQYTWRGFVRGSIQKDGSTNYGPYQLRDVDWLGRVTESATYTTAPVWTTLVNTADYVAANSTNRNNRTTTIYDNLGRVYQTLRYPGTETAKHFQTDYYYDRNGRQVCSGMKYGVLTETAFDGLGRQYQSRTVNDLRTTNPYTSGAFNYNEPKPKPDFEDMSSGDEGVIQLSHSQYEGDKAIATYAIEMNHDDGNGISLSGGAVTGGVRATSFQWYDAVGRVTTIANYGAGNGNSTPNAWQHSTYVTRPTTEMVFTDTQVSNGRVILMQYGYDSSTGKQNTVTQKANASTNQTTKTFSDRLGRNLFVVENWQSGYDPTVSIGTFTAGTNRTTGTTYNGLNQTLTQTAYNNSSSTGHQVTRYLYDNTTNASLVTSTIYPDSSDTTASGTDQIKHNYNTYGTLLSMTDQRTVIHTYTYDNQRRVILDAVTNMPGSVDNLVKSIRRTYYNTGRVKEVISCFDVGGSIVLNRILYTYHTTNGTLISEKQYHDATNFRTITYEQDAAVDGSNVYVNQLRTMRTTYPNGAQSESLFGHATDPAANANNYADRMGQVTGLRYKASGGTVKTISTYKYNGSSRLVETDNVIPQVRRQQFSSTGVYDSWDRFGRTTSSLWKKTNTSTTLDQTTYTYDWAGNRLTKSNPLATAQNQTYTYDFLNRLKSSDETTAANDRFWTLDQLGNFEKTHYNSTGTGTANETRTHNAANELATISIGATPAHDNAGNMTSIPQPAALGSSFTGKYDGWNRMVEVKSGSTVVQSNQFDGLNRRIVRIEGSETRHMYINKQGQVIEEQLGTSSTADKQYVFHPNYVDAIALYRTSAGTEYYLTQDATFNVTAVTSSAGAVLERYSYTAYGAATVLDANFAPDSNGISDMLNEHLFTGARRDPATELQYHRNRFYHPQLGIWTQRDPIGYADGMSFYRAYFVPGGVDPSGSICQKQNFCCCSTFLRIKNVQEIEFAEVGHEFDVEFAVTYVPWDGPGFADCELEWWEKSDDPPDWLIKEGYKANEWVDGYKKYSPSPVFDAWKNRNKPQAYQSEIGTLHDSPTILYSSIDVVFADPPVPFYSRTLQLAIRTVSADGCPCEKRDSQVFAKQVISLKKHETRNTGVKTDPTWFLPGFPDDEKLGLPFYEK